MSSLLPCLQHNWWFISLRNGNRPLHASVLSLSSLSNTHALTVPHTLPSLTSSSPFLPFPSLSRFLQHFCSVICSRRSKWGGKSREHSLDTLNFITLWCNPVYCFSDRTLHLCPRSPCCGSWQLRCLY
jgi:hypothetical protein